MLNIFEPIIFPIAISDEPFIVDVELTNSSGIEVPIETIVNPIIISGILNFFAKLLAPSTKKSAPLINNIKPKKINNADTNIFSPFFVLCIQKETMYAICICKQVSLFKTKPDIAINMLTLLHILLC